MKPSLVWRAPRPLRRALGVMLAAAPLLMVSACCHTPAEPPPEKFVKVPTAKARAGFERVRTNLKGEDVEASKSKIGVPLIAALRAKPVEQPAWKGLMEEFIKGLRCRDRGCYAELPAADAQRVLQIGDFVTNTGSPLSGWTGWRYVSGLYVADAMREKGEGDQLRRMAVVVLAGQARGGRQ